MKLKYAVNLHKGVTFIYVLALMFFYDNFTMGAWLYLALHGTYGFIWLLKDQVFPDRQWEKQVSKGFAIFAWFALALYWIAPWLLISRGLQPSPPAAAGAVVMV
ncbi:MAG: steroid 5-alpha reductase, partial [Bacteroidota bacterium]